jgi:hypothetical protein
VQVVDKAYVGELYRVGTKPHQITENTAERETVELQVPGTA